MKTKSKTTILVVAAVVLGIVLGRGCAGRQGEASSQARDASGEKAAAIKFWTCAMHPQIKQPNAGLCPLCRMDLVPVMASDDEQPSSLRELKLSPASIALANVEMTTVERRFVATNVRMVGKVDFDETRLAYLTARVPGRLDRLFVDYTGVPVKKGDHLVSIYSPELLAAQEELLQAIVGHDRLKDSNNARTEQRALATVAASREKLRLWGLADEQIKAIEAAGKANDHLTIFAPISGTVIQKNALEGSYVKTGTQIYTIADLSRVWVKLNAYESDLAWLHVGQDVSFAAEAYPGRDFAGKVAFIDPVLDPSTRTVKVRLNVDNADASLKPDMFVRATAKARIASGGHVFAPELAGKWISPMHPEIVKDGPGACDICGMALVPAESLGYVLGEDAEPPLVIPATAALITGKRAIVYVASPDKEGVFEGREIVLGQRAGAYYLVRRGLAEGERVVTRGAFKLDAELQINAKPSMMTPDGGGGGGHDHGGTKATDNAEHAGHGPAQKKMISSLTESQLRAVLDAAAATQEAVKHGDLTTIQKAFSGLGERVDAVRADDIRGHAVLLWKEYAMLLGNDALEGGTVQTSAAVQHVADLLHDHTVLLKKRMDLEQPEGAATVPPVNAKFMAQWSHVLDGYLGVQAALASDDFDTAKASSQAGLSALAAVDMSLVSGAHHETWMTQSGAMKNAFSQIGGSAKLNTARAAFSPLSKSVMAVASGLGAPEEALYQFECSMALGGEGARWIQVDRGTRNPYFGASMLTCGSVVDALKGNTTQEAHHHD
jgi:Cu(I)/Ag(I) efflux system membrane fusion protein